MAFTGQLNQNKIFAALYNMIISQQVFADNINGTYSSLVDAARVDGTLYGDTKLYYASDCLKSVAWDEADTNVLALHRPSAPEVQAITIDVFRQIALTVDNYLSKQAFATEGAFSSFNSVMLGWIGDTKKVYDATTYNAYIGTVAGDAAKSTVEVALSTISETGEAKNRAEAMMIANELANLFVEMKDVSRDFNDYGFLRSYDLGDLKVIWNSKFVNKIKTIDLPTIFHKDGLIDKFEEEILPARYFGEVNENATAGDGSTVRSLIEQEIGTGSNAHHYFAGDLIKSGDTAPAGTSYTVDNDVICKVMYKGSVPYMSAFSVGTSFFNPKSLTENHYLTFGHNTLDYLKNYPMITVHAD